MYTSMIDILSAATYNTNIIHALHINEEKYDAIRLSRITIRCTRSLPTKFFCFDLKPGDLLSEHSLCERFHVSRTPARSVLQRLQENGLVQIVPHKGSTVTRLNFDIINQCIYERLAVETMVMRDFIRTCTPLDVEKTRQVFSQMPGAGEAVP